MGDWHPEGTGRRSARAGRPKVGDVVAWNRAAWEITHLIDAEPTAEEAERITRYLERYRHELAPYRLTLHRLHGPASKHENDRQDMGLRVAPRYGGGHLPIYPNGRVPLCSCHGHPWPCREADEQEQAEKELKAAERELARMPGVCPACDEPVTSRQKSITFGGPNVRNPLTVGPTYHLRRRCRHGAADYEEAWVNAEPGRLRSLLTLRCAGSIIVHGDGSAECFGADDSDCPSVYASHRSYSACYLQSHGCGRGCGRHSHGCHPSGRPDDPRAVTR